MSTFLRFSRIICVDMTQYAYCIQSLKKERSLKFDFQLEFIFENYKHDVEYDIAYSICIEAIEINRSCSQK